MGSGCVASSSSNFFKKLTPDTGVQYTGDAIPSLGICHGDTLSEIEAIVLQKIIDYSTGTGITIPDIDLTACALFVDHVTCCNGCDDLPCLMQIIFESLCTLYSDVTALQTALNDLLTGPYTIGCLPIATNSTLKVIIQSLITQFCLLQSRVSTLETQVSTLTSTLTATIGTFLLNAISSCTGTTSVIKSGSGATASIAFKGFTPIGGVIPYAGSMANFDAGGLGRSGTDACGWAIADGRNGTINMKGLVPVGTTDMVSVAPISGGTLPVGTIAGEYFHTLVNAEIPAVPVSISLVDPGHRHTYNGRVDTYKFGSDFQAWDAVSPSNPAGSPGSLGDVISISTTGITATASLAGGGGAHNNMQPYRALYYIQRIS